MKKWLVLAGANGALAIMAAAYGAHGLIGGPAVSEPEVFDIAVRIQMWHALALLAVQSLEDHRPSLMTTIAGAAFMVGIVLFCGSLYLLALTGTKALGMVTPFGGVAFLIGWAGLLVGGLRGTKDS